MLIWLWEVAEQWLLGRSCLGAIVVGTLVFVVGWALVLAILWAIGQLF